MQAIPAVAQVVAAAGAGIHLAVQHVDVQAAHSNLLQVGQQLQIPPVESAVVVILDLRAQLGSACDIPWEQDLVAAAAGGMLF